MRWMSLPTISSFWAMAALTRPWVMSLTVSARLPISSRERTSMRCVFRSSLFAVSRMTATPAARRRIGPTTMPAMMIAPTRASPATTRAMRPVWMSSRRSELDRSLLMASVETPRRMAPRK